MRRLPFLLGGFALAGAVAACGGPAELPEGEVAQNGSASPRVLIAETLDLAELGPRIVGPQGPEVESRVPGLATVVSYVACPASVESDTCDPAEQPDGTLYTYVHSVTLDEPGPEQARDQWGGARLFRTRWPARGFSSLIGYDEEQALEALGDGYDIQTLADDGELIWRIAASDGWMPGETLTFYWRSANPPAGPARAYHLEADGLDGIAAGPFPAEQSGDQTAAR